MEIVRTNRQRVLADRDQRVAATFRDLRKKNKGASAAAIVRTIAATKKFNLTEPGIKRVLYSTGTLPEATKA
jgi:hypothetical protein